MSDDVKDLIREDNSEDSPDYDDYQMTLMITMLRVYDALGALLEEIRPGAGKQLYDIHEQGKLLMPAPSLTGDFGEGFVD